MALVGIFEQNIVKKKKTNKLKSKTLMLNVGHVVTLSYVVSTSEKYQMQHTHCQMKLNPGISCICISIVIHFLDFFFSLEECEE